MISLFFVDLPFLAVRLWLWALLAPTHQMPLSGFAVKNGICIVLNVMQFPLISVEVDSMYDLGKADYDGGSWVDWGFSGISVVSHALYNARRIQHKISARFSLQVLCRASMLPRQRRSSASTVQAL